MPLNIQPEAPPLRIDESGAVRVGKTRVLFVLVVRAFRDGATPEDILDMFDSLPPADVYGVIAYALRHPGEVDSYLAEYDQQAAEVWSKIEAYEASRPDLKAKREALKARIARARAATEATTPPEG